MYNMIFLPEKVDITKEKIERSLSIYMDESKFNVKFKEGGAVITVMGKDFSFIYVDREAPLEEVTEVYRHKSHIIISNLNKPKNIREGVDLQLALERFVLLVAIEMSGSFVYWSNTRKIEDLGVFNSIINQSNDVFKRTESPVNLLPLSHWISVKKETDNMCYIYGFMDFGEKDFCVQVNKDNKQNVDSIVNYIISYAFGSGDFFKVGDKISLPSGEETILYEKNGLMFLGG